MNREDLTYKTAFAHLAKYTDEELVQAARFYSNSPDGQWDNLACVAITAILLQRRKDRRTN